MRYILLILFLAACGNGTSYHAFPPAFECRASGVTEQPAFTFRVGVEEYKCLEIDQ